jgi:hypothetical protein
VWAPFQRYGDASSSSIGPSGALAPKPRTQGSRPDPEIDNEEDDDDDDERDEDDANDDESPLFPTTHEAVLKEHKKVVSALAIDPSGARFASGSHDYDCKLWDFGGMGGGVGRPFKSFEPAENYYVSIIFAKLHRTLPFVGSVSVCGLFLGF